VIAEFFTGSPPLVGVGAGDEGVATTGAVVMIGKTVAGASDSTIGIGFEGEKIGTAVIGT
jgi:hypothetical protein